MVEKAPGGHGGPPEIGRALEMHGNQDAHQHGGGGGGASPATHRCAGRGWTHLPEQPRSSLTEGSAVMVHGSLLRLLSQATRQGAEAETLIWLKGWKRLRELLGPQGWRMRCVVAPSGCEGLLSVTAWGRLSAGPCPCLLKSQPGGPGGGSWLPARAPGSGVWWASWSFCRPTVGDRPTHPGPPRFRPPSASHSQRSKSMFVLAQRRSR